ncbi:MAG TPA: Mut7-C RNAse domain-containing protein [Thermodesulfobacteriota bacterium]|nr:Mut7-C RNAse domain-containing protein [Thermodesulfobacteriota bacterium]
MNRKATETRFIADSMLGKLAKWLRLAGIDVEYDKDIDDDWLTRRALIEGRVILTRDRSIAKRKGVNECLLIWSDHLDEQLIEFLQVFELRTLQSAFTRCIRCNTLLEEVKKELLTEKVPPYVWKTQDEFKRCNTCNRIYWAGTHRENAERSLRKFIEDFYGKSV